MGMLNLDFSSVPSREPLEEGLYELTVAKAEETTSSTGNPMIKVEFDVDGFEGRKLWDNFVLIEKTLWKVKEFFEAIGLDTEEVVEMDVAELVGASMKAKVFQEEYNGDIQNRIKKYYAL
jgi:hypothetical protein